ncbi:SusC/RagA family TonB-linked outer membrane protein [Pseudoflavitalea sp. G-6-1-2]|uniref:SusC/RagA family TonB-linked outer membrane protein n=1 Tax=Pseudoflavitalea sp. G-6-1-2 TaxID=2728841 RepID=UPI00146D8CFE|nr:SusC/RagA family TonB-linked outer membrane protein [Pseudoflavitalea sp. G-6-1-2]NML21327.1 SusC/RagA family TonB-linked outer membrane protein [Pseudoflavitalea sp. G-6-1-2]
MKRLLLVFTCLLSVLLATAQTRTITGIVKDEKGDPIAAASVRAKGARSGTTTKSDGSFSLTLAQSATTIVISSVGYSEQEIQLTPAISYDITLQKGKGQELSEVVVTAQGISRDRRSLGYATTNLKTDQIANKGEVNLVNALQGKVAGVNITSASGSPGASSNINIRGITSFLGNNQPLFVVDGIPISNDVDRSGSATGSLGDAQPGNRISDLNLSNIESVNILKGPAAAALYGSRASNGAIMITTKKGAGGKGRLDVSLSSSYGIQKVSGLPDFQNSYGQGTQGVHNPLNANSWGPKFGTTPTQANGLIDPKTNEVRAYELHKDNIRDFFQTGNLNENNLTINTGDATQNATLNLGHLIQHGIVPNTKLKRTNIQFGGNTTIGKFKLGATVTYVNSSTTGALGGNQASGGTGWGLLVNVPRSLDLQAYKDNYKNADWTQNYSRLLENKNENPYYTAYENPMTSNLSRFIGSATISYDILPWLNASYRFGADSYTDRRKVIYATGSIIRKGGSILEDNFFRQELNSDLMVTAKKKDIFTQGLNASAMLGWGVNQRKFQNVSAQGRNLVIPGFYNLKNATSFLGTGETSTLRRLVGFYGQLNLDWNNYLFLDLTARVDQSSTLPKNKNTYVYPSVAASFVFTDAFDISSNILSYGKLRASAAQVGRDAEPYQLNNVFTNASLGNNVAQIDFPVIVGGGSFAGFTRNNVFASNTIKPEFTTSYEIGANLGFLKNRLTLDVAVFNTVSKNQIVTAAVPGSSGYLRRLINVGKMTNKGIEIALSGSPVISKEFTWDVAANFTSLKNKVVEIGEGIESFSINDGESFSGTVPSIAKGYAYGVIIGIKNTKTADGQYLINPTTGLWDPADYGIVADPNPEWTAGITNTLRYKGISLGFLFDFTKGGDIYSFTAGFLRTRGMLKETEANRDKPFIVPGVLETSPGKFVPNNIQVTAQQYWQGMGIQSELSVFDATVLRLRELSLGYDLPSHVLAKTPLSLARLTLFARNLWFYAPNYPLDPEVNTQGAGNLRGLDLQGAPNAKTMGVSLKVSFK